MRRFITNPWLHFLFLLLLLIAAVIFSGSNHEVRKRLQYATFDYFNEMHPREKLDAVSVIDIDEDSLLKLGQFPWPRSVMADLILRLKEMGAKVVAFDMVFAEADRTSPKRIADNLPEEEKYSDIRNSLRLLPDNDQVFSDAIKSTGNIVTGFTRARPEESLRNPSRRIKPTFLIADRSPFLKNTFSAPGVVTNLPKFSSVAAGNGSFMATPDVDGIIRQVSLFNVYPPKQYNSFNPTLYPMLGLEALRVSIHPNAGMIIAKQKNKSAFDTRYNIKIGKNTIPIERDSKLWVYYRDIAEEEYVSAYKVLNDDYKDEVSKQVKDKIVLVGTSAEGLRDIRSTPLDIFVPGVEVHVNVIEQILQGKYLKRLGFMQDVEGALIGIAGLMIIALGSFIGVIWLGCFTILLVAGLFYGSLAFYVSDGLLIDPVYPAAVLLILFVTSALLSYVRSEADRRHVKTAFGHYISPAFMEELTKNPDKLKLGGEVRELSVMFTDIRSFTKISEQLTPE